MSSTAAEVRFTNYSIGAHERLGRLVPEATDKWWIIGPGAESGTLANEIVSMIDRYGVPWLHAQMAHQGCNQGEAG